MASDRKRAGDRNPYVIGVPLTDSDGFYGRTDTFRFIHDVLDARKQNVVVLYGQRRIGKTSVLHRAVRWLHDDGAFFPVYYDLQGKGRLSLGEVLENLAQTLARRLELPRPDPKAFDDDGRYFSGTFLPQALEKLGQQRLVLLIDEFDVLGDELESPRAAARTLFPYLQDLIVTRPQIGFVFVVGRRIEELATHFQAVFKQAVFRRIGRLKPEDSRGLIVEPARGMITYDSAAVQRIQKLAAGHPYFTQLLCFEIFNAAKGSGGSVTADAVDLAATRAIETGHGALNWFWEGLPRAERFVLAAVAHATDESGLASTDAIQRLLEEHRVILSGLEFKDAPERLVEWEMLVREGDGTYQFVVEIVRRWVVKEHPLSSARRDIDLVNKRAVRLYENAREAHEQGDLEFARAEYQRALVANSNHSGAQLGLALVLYELGDLDRSITEFERAYTIDEVSARDGLIRARLAKAKALDEAGQTDASAAQYQKVLVLAPHDATSKKRLAAILMDRGDAALQSSDLVAGATAYTKALSLERSDEALGRARTALLDVATRFERRADHQSAALAYLRLTELLRDAQPVRTQAVEFACRAGEALAAGDHLEAAADLYKTLLARFAGDPALTERLNSVKERIAERKNIDRIFTAATAAHRASDFGRARDLYKQLIQCNVYVHREINIPLSLWDAVSRLSPASAGEHTVPAAAPTKVVTPQPPARVSRLRRLLPPGLLLLLTLGGLYAALPKPAVVAVTLPQPQTLRPDTTTSLTPQVGYDSTVWRQPEPVRVTDFTWRSDNERVATVSDGTVRATGEGKATITAALGSVSGSTAVTVTPWSIAPMKADVTDIRFFQQSDSRRVFSEQNRFSMDEGPVFAELKFQMPDPFATREREATLAYTLFHSGRRSDRYPFKVTVEPRSPDLSAVVRLEFRGGIRPGRYSVAFDHERQVIRTGDFEVY